MVEDLQSMCTDLISKNWEVLGLLADHLPPHLQHKIQTCREQTNEIIYPIASNFE